MTDGPGVCVAVGVVHLASFGAAGSDYCCLASVELTGELADASECCGG